VLKELTRVSDIEVVASKPVVSHRESISFASLGPYDSGSCLGKSANKHNRVYVSARPIPTEVVDLLAAGSHRDGSVSAGAGGGVGVGASSVAVEGGRDNRTAVAALLGLDPRRVWALGPERKSGGVSEGDGSECATNVLVDCTHGIDNMHVIKDLVVAAFFEVSC
jgi:elongation factor 2